MFDRFAAEQIGPATLKAGFTGPPETRFYDVQIDSRRPRGLMWVRRTRGWGPAHGASRPSRSSSRRSSLHDDRAGHAAWCMPSPARTPNPHQASRYRRTGRLASVRGGIATRPRLRAGRSRRAGVRCAARSGWEVTDRALRFPPCESAPIPKWRNGGRRIGSVRARRKREPRGVVEHQDPIVVRAGRLGVEAEQVRSTAGQRSRSWTASAG